MDITVECIVGIDLDEREATMLLTLLEQDIVAPVHITTFRRALYDDLHQALQRAPTVVSPRTTPKPTVRKSA